MTQNNNTLVDVKDLSKLFPIGQGVFKRAESYVHAVSHLNLKIKRGESVGLVGESGCGKTTTGKLLTRLLDPTEGNILLDTDEGQVDIAHMRGSEMKIFRRRVQMIFQDPYESMNPRLTIYDTVAEPLNVQGVGSVAEREARVADLLETVGLTPASSFLFRYPHELSGGQRQRVAIARALVINPDFVVADEPTSMLDVSVRTGVMHLMQNLAERFGVTYLYITHDLAVARYMCDRIAVMYLGKIVEIGDTEDVLQRPQHPYTKALLSAVPVPDPTYNRDPIKIKGGITRPVDPEPRCRFYDRCPIADKVCESNDHPPLEDKGTEHYAACYHV
ncbi:MAG: ABC transporter ATP-binding protein [Anaerolineales bacterium]|nr:ABC transporter ATP-binding protein [Chloroflexota bacterium]MBL6980274.1 ABC transporter ATP-binding protein [Anaerolineales bacterium]